MTNQIDSPDGKPRKDPHRPSPALVETDDPGTHTSPAAVPYKPHESPPNQRGEYPAPGPAKSSE